VTTRNAVTDDVADTIFGIAAVILLATPPAVPAGIVAIPWQQQQQTQLEQQSVERA